jgi:glycosyltransferase involved in cell wall biosynthesis
MSNPLVSVVICTYNGERYLEQTLESVLTQTHGNLEILIVDDGSTDGTPSLVAAFAANHPRIRPFFRTNHGLPAARNFAFENAKGDWIAIIDQDDLCYPSRLARQIEVSNENPSAALIFCNTHFIDENDRVIGDHLSKFSLPERFIPKGLAGNLLLQVGCFIDSEAFFMKRDAALAIGRLDDSLCYACDYEYFVRAGFAVDFAYTSDVLAAWRIHADQATATSPKIRQQVRTVYRRYFWARGVDFLTKIHLLKNLTKSYAGQFLDAAKSRARAAGRS